MGFSPVEVDRMDIWQFTAALNGHQIANGKKAKSTSPDLSDDDLREMGVEGFT